MSSAMKIRREAIINMAFQLLDRDGLEGVTLRKIASELHVHVGALYWHVKHKQDLLDEMANVMLLQQFAEFDGFAPERRWSDELIEICTRLRRAMLSHRDGARVVAGAQLGRAVTLARLFDVTIRSLMAAGFPLRLAYLTCMTTIAYVYGFVIEEQAAPDESTVSSVRSDESIVAALMQENAANNYTADTDFIAGLELTLDGIKQKFAEASSH
jgi:TetR/AcrR family transcriptional regulator, tetracycline repressor protein